MWRLILSALIVFMPSLVLAVETEKVDETARLNIKTVPSCVEIQVNSETIGFSPIRNLVLPPGEYVISTSFDETGPVEKTVFLAPGVATDVWFYPVDLAEGSGFRTRDFLIGVGLFWGLLGLSVAIIFAGADFG